MRYLIPVCACLFAAGLAHAQDPEKTEPTVTQLSVSLEDCKRLVRHKTKGDVAYKLGVDVHGKAVKPADLQPLGAIKIPDEIVIDFGLDLAGRYGFGGAALFDATAGIATIHYDIASGGLTFNGQPLHNADLKAVERACEMRLKPQ